MPMGSGSNKRGEQTHIVICCPSTLQPTPSSSSHGNILPIPGSLHAPSLWLLHLCPCRDTPKTQTTGSAGRLWPRCHHASICIPQSNPTPQALWPWSRLGLHHSPQAASSLWDTLFSQHSEVSVQGFVLPGLLLTCWIRQVFLKSSFLFQTAGEEIPLGIRLGSITLEQNRGCQQGERRGAVHGHPSEKTDSRLRHHTYRSTEFRTTMQHHLSQNDACTYLYHRLINLLPGRQTASGSKRGPRKGSEKINKQTIA